MSVPLEIDVQDAFCLHPLPDGGAVAALRGLTLTVGVGERLIVHGPNGSGKTTLLRALVGEQRLAAGHAVVAGLNLAGAGPAQLAAWRATRLGQVDQLAGRLLRPEFDVLDNVALQLRVGGMRRQPARAQALALLDRLGLAELADRRPGTLSGGQSQRVAVCAALAHGPQLVLADEPTGELDLKSADAVYELLATAVSAAGATLVLVTHDRRAGAIADRVVRIRDGRISETWRPVAQPALESRRSLSEQPGLGAQPRSDAEAEPETSAGQDSRPAREALVLDARGWVRIPIDLRRQLGLGSQLTVSAKDGTLLLRPDPDDVAPAETTSTTTRVTPTAQPALSAVQPRSQVEAPSRGAAPSKSAAPSQADGSSESGDPPEKPGPIAEVTGIVVRYNGQAVLDSPTGEGVALSASPGQVVVISGRSGAGKSTLLRVVLGLQRPDAGIVKLAGIDLADRSRAELAAVRTRCSAVVMQQIHLAATADAVGNLDLARSARGLPPDPAFVSWQLERLELAGLAHRPVAGLSGGERQRLAVARALAVAPALLVLDEPTSQLDEASAEMLTDVLREVADQGTAVLVASHDPVLIAVADRLCQLA